jgi:hypothetical protein
MSFQSERGGEKSGFEQNREAGGDSNKENVWASRKANPPESSRVK